MITRDELKELPPTVSGSRTPQLTRFLAWGPLLAVTTNAVTDHAVASGQLSLSWLSPDLLQPRYAT